MCGICGIHPAGPQDMALVERMLGALSHRGPDGSGYYLDDDVILGHTRLAIVDPAGGAQPMATADSRLWVSFNGEIFNHVELRAQLEDRGHVFRTRSDTEVILHAFQEWGPEAFGRFNGQWAIALWDRVTKELILSRDRYGVRPLYYARSRGRLLFASEMKALFTDGSLPFALDPAGLDQTLTFWCPVAPRTPFAGVEQVPPGTYLRFREGHMSRVTYWTPAFPEPGSASPRTLDEHAEELRERLTKAVRLRFTRSDVPVGAYLSGGIDSAVTTAIITSIAGIPVDTFSLRFTDRDFDEGPYQSLLTRQFGTVHHDVEVRESDIAEAFPDVVRHAEHTLLRTAPAPMFLLSRLVREQGFKVVVTGEGADEVWGGYDIFQEAKVRRFWARNPESAVRSRAVELLYPWLSRSPNRAPAFSAGFFGRNLDPADPALSHRPRWDSTSALKGMLTEPMRAAHPKMAEEELLQAMPDREWDTLGRAQWLEMVTLLPGYILASQGDRMLMAHSVEGRFPFLDPELGRYAGTVPSRHKILGLDEKHLVKRAFAGRIPDEVLKRPKQPYRAPGATGFFNDGAPDWVADVTSQPEIARVGIFRPEIVARLVAKARSSQGRALGNTDDMRLVAVLSTQLLAQGFGGPSPEPPQPMTVMDHRGWNGEEHASLRG